jgi:hypothetical protein
MHIIDGILRVTTQDLQRINNRCYKQSGSYPVSGLGVYLKRSFGTLLNAFLDLHRTRRFISMFTEHVSGTYSDPLYPVYNSTSFVRRIHFNITLTSNLKSPFYSMELVLPDLIVPHGKLLIKTLPSSRYNLLAGQGCLKVQCTKRLLASHARIVHRYDISWFVSEVTPTLRITAYDDIIAIFMTSIHIYL